MRAVSALVSTLRHTLGKQLADCPVWFVSAQSLHSQHSHSCLLQGKVSDHLAPAWTVFHTIPCSLGSDVDVPPMHEPKQPVTETASSQDETAPPWSRINSKTSSSQPMNMDTSIKDTAGAVVRGKGNSMSTDAMPTHGERNSSAATSALVEALTAQLNHPATSSPPSLLELPVADLRGSSRNPLDVQRTGTVTCWCSVAFMHAIIHCVLDFLK
jgi:hypothetical protein